jgi:hypothetical protein
MGELRALGNAYASVSANIHETSAEAEVGAE